MTGIRKSVRAKGRSWLVVAALAVVCLALVSAHSGPGLEHMNEMEHGPAQEPANAVMSVCLAVMTTAVVLLGAWSGLRRRHPRPWLVHRFSPATVDLCLSDNRLPAARAGPAQLQVFLR